MNWLALLIFAPYFVLATPNTATKPMRIVALTPALTEILFAIGAGAQIVGVSSHSDYPEAAKLLPRVGDYAKPNLEKLIALKPDLIIGSTEGVDTYSQSLVRQGLRLELVDLKKISDYPKAIRRLSELLNLESGANSPADLTVNQHLQKWEQEWESIHTTTNSKKILVQVDHNPIVIAGHDSFLSEILNRCGHTNVAQDKSGYPTIQTEALIKMNPNVVLLTVHGSKSVRDDVIRFWQRQNLISKPQIIEVDASSVSRLGPRLPAVAKDLCRQISVRP